MTKLSPAAKAVLDAANGCSCYGPDDCLNESRWIAAGALRAAVDQAIPMTKSPWGSILVPVLSSEESRDRLLAIADELEGGAS